MKTNKWLLGLMMLTFWPSNSKGFQQKPDDVAFSAYYRFGTGETFVQQCKVVENLDLQKQMAPTKDVQHIGECIGFISGVLDLNTFDSGVAKDRSTNGWCVPDSATTTQLAKVVVKYGNDHPQELHLPAVLVVSSALIGAFPCSH